ncbi:MAG TPA: MFS transporter, partial [Candidatus Limnocylindrales bacterium]|nr:MFS transporter [Candidatus Limnocylindrales bacterium]
MLRTYRELLRNGPLARLLVGEFVSSIGDWLYLVALVVLVYRETQDPVILGLVGAARMLPYIFLSIPAGIITDRFDRRHVLLASDLARGACMLVLAGLVATDGPLVAIAAVAMLAACFSTFFYPAIGALIPSLVRDETEFGPANS